MRQLDGARISLTREELRQIIESWYNHQFVKTALTSRIYNVTMIPGNLRVVHFDVAKRKADKEENPEKQE